jgi:pyridoxal/pyridoxine/pyridoxamine kinase
MRFSKHETKLCIEPNYSIHIRAITEKIIYSHNVATKIHNPEGWLYDPVLPDPENWPIYQLSKAREAFIKEFIALSTEIS